MLGAIELGGLAFEELEGRRADGLYVRCKVAELRVDRVGTTAHCDDHALPLVHLARLARGLVRVVHYGSDEHRARHEPEHREDPDRYRGFARGSSHEAARHALPEDRDWFVADEAPQVLRQRADRRIALVRLPLGRSLHDRGERRVYGLAVDVDAWFEVV